MQRAQLMNGQLLMNYNEQNVDYQDGSSDQDDGSYGDDESEEDEEVEEDNEYGDSDENQKEYEFGENEDVNEVILADNSTGKKTINNDDLDVVVSA